MSDSGNAPTLAVGHGGFLFWDGVRLPVRYVDSKLEFVIKNPRDRARLKCKRVQIPLDEFKALAQVRLLTELRKATLRDFRAAEHSVNVSRRNKRGRK